MFILFPVIYFHFNSEKLFEDKYMFITREDLNTLSSEDGISEKVVDLWAHLLNVGEKKRGSSSISRYFVPMPHMVFSPLANFEFILLTIYIFNIYLFLLLFIDVVVPFTQFLW